jgi:hypothetical protein
VEEKNLEENMGRSERMVASSAASFFRRSTSLGNPLQMRYLVKINEFFSCPAPKNADV